MVKKRKLWIDALRAIAMIFVIIWHISSGVQGQWIYNLFTSPIMIPLFFAISGYLFNDCGGHQIPFIQKIGKYLVLPWLSLALIKGTSIALFRQSSSYYIEYIENLFNGTNLWYFPCCILAEIMFFYILKFSKGRHFIELMLVLVFTILGFLLRNISACSYLNIHTACICQCFLFLGMLIKRNELFLNSYIKRRVVYYGGAIYIILCFLIMYTFRYMLVNNNMIFMDVHTNDYSNVLICFCQICIGVLVLFILIRRFSNFSRPLIFIGQNTIVFYIFHYDALLPYKIFWDRYIEYSHNWFYVFMGAIWSVLCCFVIALCLNRFAPILEGKKKKS